MPIDLPSLRTPFLRYSPKRDIWQIGGDAIGTCTLSLEGAVVAFDVENVRRGWLTGQDGGEGTRRRFRPVVGLQGEMGPAPEGAVVGLSLFAFAPKAFGSETVYEMTNSTFSHLEFVARLYCECEAQFGKGTVPLVALGPTQETLHNGYPTRLLSYTVKKFVPRAAAFLKASAKQAGAPRSGLHVVGGGGQ